MGRKVTSKLELKSVSEVLSDVRLDAGFQAAVDTARYYIEKYRTQRNSSKISQIGQWFLTFKDDKSKSEEILDVALSSSDALFELGNYEKSIDLAKEGYDLAQNATEEARTHSAHSLGRKCIRYGMSIHGSKPDAAARFLQESLNTILDQLSLLDKQIGETFQKSSLQICAGILFYYLEQSSLDPNFGLAINRFHLAEGLLAEAKDSATYSEEGINHLLKLLYYYRGKALQRMDASEKASDELLSALKYPDLNESVDNLECPLYLAVEAPPNVSIHLELAYLYASQLRLISALNHIQNWEASNQNFDLKSQVETIKRNITAIQRLNDECNHNDVRELYKSGNQLMVLSDFLSLDGDLNLHKIRNEAIRVFEKCKEMCRQRENQNAVDIRAINQKLGILLSDGSREDKCLALQYLSKDLNLSKSCSNDDEAKAYEKAYKLMIELDKSPDQAMKLLECLGDYFLNERSNAETAALWKSGLAYFRNKGDIARAKKCRAMIDEIPGAIDDLKLSDIDLDDFFSPIDVSENIEDVERSYVIAIHGETFTINVDATMAVTDVIKLIQNEYQDRFGREPIIDELQTNKGVPLSAHSILARVVSPNNQLSALSSGFTQVFAHELYQKECQKTDTTAMDQVTQCLRVGDETCRFLFRCLGLYSRQATAVITSISSSNIQELDLSKNLFNDSDLQYMCDIGMELDNLAKLGLSSNRFTLTGLLLFFNRYDCPKLEDIDISSTLLDDLNGWELFLSLAKYKELSKIVIEGTKLRIEDTRINYNESSTPLFPNLVHLSLSNNRNLKISESFVQTLTQACPNLEVLNLSRLLYIGNSISRLSALKKLKRLNCSWVKSWGSEKLKLQELLKQNGSLEILDVAYTNLDFDSFLHGLTLNYCLKEMRCIGIPLSNHDFESLIQVVDSNRDCKLMNISYGCFDGENEIDPDLTDRLHQALLNIIRKSG